MTMRVTMKVIMMRVIINGDDGDVKREHGESLAAMMVEYV